MQPVVRKSVRTEKRTHRPCGRDLATQQPSALSSGQTPSMSVNVRPDASEHYPYAGLDQRNTLSRNSLQR
jgi:hypothetical protein